MVLMTSEQFGYWSLQSILAPFFRVIWKSYSLSSFSLTSLAVCVISLQKLERIENNPNYKKNTLITRFCFEVLINLILLIHVLRGSGTFCSMALQYVFLKTDLFAVQMVQGMCRWIFLVYFLFVSCVNLFEISIPLCGHLLTDPSRLLVILDCFMK